MAIRTAVVLLTRQNSLGEPVDVDDPHDALRDVHPSGRLEPVVADRVRSCLQQAHQLLLLRAGAVGKRSHNESMTPRLPNESVTPIGTLVLPGYVPPCVCTIFFLLNFTVFSPQICKTSHSFQFFQQQQKSRAFFLFTSSPLRHIVQNFNVEAKKNTVSRGSNILTFFGSSKSVAHIGTVIRDCHSSGCTSPAHLRKNMSTPLPPREVRQVRRNRLVNKPSVLD